MDFDLEQRNQVQEQRGTEAVAPLDKTGEGPNVGTPLDQWDHEAVVPLDQAVVGPTAVAPG